MPILSGFRSRQKQPARGSVAMREPDGVIGFAPHLSSTGKEGKVLRFRLMIKRGLNETAKSIE
jgi:hypothetical protein